MRSKSIAATATYLVMTSTFSILQLDADGVPYEAKRSDAVDINTRWYPTPEDITIPAWGSTAVEVLLESDRVPTLAELTGRDFNEGKLRFGCFMTRDMPIVPNYTINRGSPTIVTLELWNSSGSTQTLPKGSLILFAVPEISKS